MASNTAAHSGSPRVSGFVLTNPALNSSTQVPQQQNPKPKFTVLEWIRAGFRFPLKGRS